MRRVALGCSAIVGLLAILASCASFDTADAPGDGGASSSGGPAPPAEDCLDGRDDNDDGKRDCEEPSCAPYVHCVPGPGTLGDWNGYVALVTNGDCPADVPNGSDVWAASAERATCAACKCDATIDCTGQVSVAESIFAGCNPQLPFTLTIGQCGTIPAASGGTASYWQYATASVGNAKCTPTSDPPKLGAKYQSARLCTGARVGAGCPSGQVCAKSASGAGGGTGACIVRSLAGGPPVPCPNGFPVAHVVVPRDRDPESAFVEKRACTECKCGAVTGSSCNAVLTLFSDNNCGTSVGTVKPGACSNLSCGGSKACGSGRIDTSNPTAGSCPPSGGDPTGSVELTTAGQQLCCDR